MTAACGNQEIAGKVKDGTPAHEVYDQAHGKYAPKRPVLRQPAAPSPAPSPVKGGK